MELLLAYGFGPDFRRWVSTFYKGAFMQIIINDWLTGQIPLGREVRQGDPLSALLYVLCVEVLASLIRSSPEIEGFLLPGASACECACMRMIPQPSSRIFNLSRIFSNVLMFMNVALGPSLIFPRLKRCGLGPEGFALTSLLVSHGSKR